MAGDRRNHGVGCGPTNRGRLAGQGVRARVATSTDIVEFERRIGRVALEPHNRRWRTARGDGGWVTAYAYQPDGITSERLSQAWTLRADGVTQNITLFPDGHVSATLAVRTPQPPTVPPSVMLQTLPGEQVAAVAAAMCVARPQLGGLRRGAIPSGLVIPIGPSGVLLGKLPSGERLLLPLGDPGESSRVHIASDDTIAKRIIIRAAAAGDRITIHSRDLQRWDGVRMSQIAVSEQARPASSTTVSVVDGSVSVSPRPNTVISVGPADTTSCPLADVVISQTGPASIEVTTAGEVFQAEVELFRAENRYLSTEPTEVRPEEPEWATQR